MSTKIFTTAVLAVFAATSAFADTYEITQWGEKIAPDSEIVNPFYDNPTAESKDLGGNTYVIKIAGATAENPFELKDSDGTTGSRLTFAKEGSLIIDGCYVARRVGNGANNDGLIIRDGSSLTITGGGGDGVNFWNGGVSVGENANSGAKLVSTASTMLFKVGGTVVVNGELSSTYKSFASNKFAYAVTNITFNAGAKMNSVSGAGFTTYDYNSDWKNPQTITVNAGVEQGALAVAGVFNFAGKTTVNFNSSNAFSTDGNTQAKSTFTLVSYNKLYNGEIRADKTKYPNAAADVVFNSTANNSFGQIQFWTDSTLTLNLDAKSFMAFGEFVMDSDASGSLCTVIVNNLSDSSKTFFISDKIYEAIDYGTVILKDSNGNELSYIATKASDEDFAMTGLDSELGGGYWLAVNSVVPEPATYAALFGLFALGFVLYRRRR